MFKKLMEEREPRSEDVQPLYCLCHIAARRPCKLDSLQK